MGHLKSVNPFNQEIIKEYPKLEEAALDEKVETAFSAFQAHRQSSFEERAEKLRKMAHLLNERAEEYAPLLTREMGKPLREAEAELKKCAWVCEYYAENGAEYLSPREEETDADESYVSYEPLGPVLAIMPWNFPFWQVYRFAAPALMAGNVALLKHAPNVQGCAELIEQLFLEVGFAEGCFQNLTLETDQVERLIENPKVRAVTLTGSVRAGEAVAASSGKALKKNVLELGGSNSFIVLEDADIEKAVNLAVSARMMNNAQSCIAAKRFLVAQPLVQEFTAQITEKVKNLKMGDPREADTDIGPLARIDLAEQLEEQVEQSRQAGAHLETGGERDRAFYQPTVLSGVKPGMPAFDEELFGPVVAVMAVKDLDEAIGLSNKSDYGLGVTLVTRDVERARKSLHQFEDGAVFVNELVKSDPRLPFGGTKRSGYGRELSREGIREFVNVKTVYLKKSL